MCTANNKLVWGNLKVIGNQHVYGVIPLTFPSAWTTLLFHNHINIHVQSICPNDQKIYLQFCLGLGTGWSFTAVTNSQYISCSKMTQIIWKGKYQSIVCMGKIAASVLLKLFINGFKRWHTNDAPSAWAELYFQMLTTYNSWSLKTR